LEQAGLQVFRNKGQCGVCHTGPNFSDDQFHNTGVSWRDGHILDEGRFAVSHKEADHARSKRPRYARSRGRLRTCTTAAWQHSRTWLNSIRVAVVRILISIPKS